MGILRSESMRSGTLVVPLERARHFINVVGSGVNLEFVDSNEEKLATKRPYLSHVRRIDEMEREGNNIRNKPHVRRIDEMERERDLY
jgi:V-type H+-transporting ATPase subunit a